MGSYLEDKEERIKRERRKKEKDMQRKRDKQSFRVKTKARERNHRGLKKRRIVYSEKVWGRRERKEEG